MFGILKMIDLIAVWEGNLEVISDLFCGSDHVIPKHAQSRWSPHNIMSRKSMISTAAQPTAC